MNFPLISERSISDEEECKWDYFRKLKHLNDNELNENDENLRKYINDIDNSDSSLLNDDEMDYMNALERSLVVGAATDIISENIHTKISDPKEKMLITLLYKVCNDIDPTRMQFIKFCVALKSHGIITNLNFLTNEKCNQQEQEMNNDSENNNNMSDLPLMRLMSSSDINNNTNVSNSESIISRYYNEFEEIECIGYGSFGTVHKVKNKLDLSIYAMKKIIYKHDSINYETIKNEIIREIKNIAQLNHQNIVRYYNSWIENGPITATNTNSLNNKPNINNNENRNRNETIEMKTNNTMSFFDYKIDKFDDINLNLNPLNSIPILRTKSNEGLSVLLSADAKQSLITPVPIIDIMNYWEHQTTYSCLFLQTEYCGKYTLKDFINNPNRIPDRDNNMHILSQILLGIAHIHSKYIIHRDLKPSNIFLMRNKNNTTNMDRFTVKIGDFGLSKSLKLTHLNGHENEFNNHKCNGNDFTYDIGTDTYSSPEQLNGNGNNNMRYDISTDIYSLGIILFELIQYPFDTMMERRIAISKFRNNKFIDFERINQQKFRNEIDLMLSMTNNKPLMRPSAYQLILNENIQRYWMENILNNAMPHYKVKEMATQKSLEYNINDNIEISLNHSNDKKNNNEKESDSPTFLLTSPKSNELFNMELK